MTYRKRTLRIMSPTARKVARLIGELQSVANRLKNLIPDIQSLDLDSKALANAKQPNIRNENEIRKEIGELYVEYSGTKIADAGRAITGTKLDVLRWVLKEIDDKPSEPK